MLLTPPHTDHDYRCERRTRTDRGSRPDLRRKAPDARRPGDGARRNGYRLVIAGAPDSPEALQRLEMPSSTSGMRSRVELIPRFISDAEKLDLLARCSASVYLPIDEDSYGYVCYEAAMSSKPTITAHAIRAAARRSSTDGVSGFVVEPDPEAIARAFDRIGRSASEGRRPGTHGADDGARSWTCRGTASSRSSHDEGGAGDADAGHERHRHRHDGRRQRAAMVAGTWRSGARSSVARFDLAAAGTRVPAGDESACRRAGAVRPGDLRGGRQPVAYRDRCRLARARTRARRPPRRLGHQSRLCDAHGARRDEWPRRACP